MTKSIDNIMAEPVTLTLWLAVETIGDRQMYSLHASYDKARHYVCYMIDEYLIENMPADLDVHREFTALLHSPELFYGLLKRFAKFSGGKRVYSVHALSVEVA